MKWYRVILLAAVACALVVEARGQMLSEDRESPVIEAREGAARVRRPLPEERSMVVNRRAKFAKDDATGLYQIRFVAEPGKDDEVPRLALPNPRLEGIEKILAEYPDAVFTISGETTVYERRAYLLIRLAAVDLPAKPAGMAGNRTAAGTAGSGDEKTTQPAGEKSSPVAEDAPALSPEEEWLLSEPDADDTVDDAANNAAATVIPETQAADPAATEKPSTAQADSATSKPASGTDPDSIIRAMLQERPGTPILAPVDDDTTVQRPPSVAPLPRAVRMQMPTMFGALLNERVVRLAQDKDGWWFIRFENDNALTQPPIRVLPSSNLTKARMLTKSKTGVEIRIIVWGEVVSYKGTQYILLRRVVKHQPMGRF